MHTLYCTEPKVQLVQSEYNWCRVSALCATAGGLSAYQLFAVTRHPASLQWLCGRMLGVAERAFSLAVGDLLELGHWRGQASPPGPTCCIQPLSQSAGDNGDIVEQVENTTRIDKVKDILYVVISNVLGN